MTREQQMQMAQMQKMQAEEQKMAEFNEQKNQVMGQILAPAARERLANIKLAKPERAAQLEQILITHMQSGKLTGKVSDDMLLELLEQINEQTESTGKVEIKRKQMIDSSDEEEDLDAMFG